MTELESERALARLFGNLLVFELDAVRLEELRAPEVAAALADLGIVAPPATTSAEIDDLAAQFHAQLLQPKGGPLVQSLWTSGSYQGQAATTLRKLGEVAALDFDGLEARGAQPDHLGAILLLWAETSGFAPEVAERLDAEHFEWALKPLAALARSGGFYGQVGDAVGRWILNRRNAASRQA